MIYICENVSKVYLSQTALKNLHIIPRTFPKSEHFNSCGVLNDTAPCGCPRRTECPPIPEGIPFPATPENRENLEKWIVEYYRSSAFNTCEHQKLQSMSGEPLNISFLPDSRPVAVHKPIPVPHHWKAEVKTQLDVDVTLGIIEPVPTGTPTTWCSRMITVPKKTDPQDK